eukprot:SAG22_NODE_236_length_14254_cov_3.426492_3_plen_172_part_00
MAYFRASRKPQHKPTSPNRNFECQFQISRLDLSLETNHRMGKCQKCRKKEATYCDAQSGQRLRCKDCKDPSDVTRTANKRARDDGVKSCCLSSTVRIRVGLFREIARRTNGIAKRRRTASKGDARCRPTAAVATVAAHRLRAIPTGVVTSARPSATVRYFQLIFSGYPVST